MTIAPQVDEVSGIRRTGLAILITVIALDQITKWLVLEIMQPARIIEVLPFFNIVLWYNRGISFGLFQSGSALQTWLLIGLAGFIVLLLLYWLKDAKTWMSALAIGAVAGGAIGNVIDRVMPSRRGVVDFLDFHAFGYHWPAFNIADSAIVVGVVLLLAGSLINDGKVPRTKPGENI